MRLFALVPAMARRSSPTVALVDATVGGSGGDAEYGLLSSGDIQGGDAVGGVSDIGDWILPKAAAGAAYEMRRVTSSGALSAGPANNTWVSLGSNQFMIVIAPGAWSGTVSIRRAADAVVLTTATITITAV